MVTVSEQHRLAGQASARVRYGDTIHGSCTIRIRPADAIIIHAIADERGERASVVIHDMVMRFIDAKTPTYTETALKRSVLHFNHHTATTTPQGNEKRILAQLAPTETANGEYSHGDIQQQSHECDSEVTPPWGGG